MQGYGKIMVMLVILVNLEAANGNQCLKNYPDVKAQRTAYMDGQSLPITLELTHRVTQRLVTRIMKIFLTEVLGYAGVTLVNLDDKFTATNVFIRMSDTDATGRRHIPETMVNMEVWIPPQNDATLLQNRFGVKECGAITYPGRFGWFVPEELSESGDNWKTFTDRKSAERFSIDSSTLQRIRKTAIDPKTGKYYCDRAFCIQGMYIPDYCKSEKPCALLFTTEVNVTDIVKEHIDQLKLYVKVIWLGPNLREVTTSLTEKYRAWNKNLVNSKKSLVILHWTPSEVIPNERKFTAIDFPRQCFSKEFSVGCIYETNQLVKLVWSRLAVVAKPAWQAINRAQFSSGMYQDLINHYNMLSSNETEDDVACRWLQKNLNYTLWKWVQNSVDKDALYIGGIFPMTGRHFTAKSVLVATKMANDAINANETILPNHNIVLHASDGQCQADLVMKSFIDLILHNHYERLIGVLGPACSNTVETLVGVSKHYRTIIISYGAEGSSSTGHSSSPYFYRTVGINKEYRFVYMKFMKQFGWKRVAAITEDGQKYTEYLSYMQDYLRDNGISLIANMKFPKERKGSLMTQYLKDLKDQRVRIIIADVFDSVCREVMCQAFKLRMTQPQGYIWFLPLWLNSNWYDTDYHNKVHNEKVPCTTEEMLLAINGHFQIFHALYAPDDDIMQTGSTVGKWRREYEDICRKTHQVPSPYAGYAYDAMWTYAYAMDRLINENESYVFDLHSEKTAKRLAKIISESDFNGVSGNVRFYGASRLTVMKVRQRVNNVIQTIGTFYPEVSFEKEEVIGGNLTVNLSAIVWQASSTPDDGTEVPEACLLGLLPDALNISCTIALILVNILAVASLTIPLITAFVTLKRKYANKVEEQRKVMASFGLNINQSTSAWDDWEIPRDRVVINRRLGEGAFGTVYGGEAFFPDRGWRAVAVKTLKSTSTTDDKLDFLGEVEVMKRFQHKNIVKLFAVCIKAPPVLTVMEYMLYGDLKTYLLARRHMVDDQEFEESDEVSNERLTGMAMDVARGLSYLAQKKYIHRDLASRNCLVNAQRVVKLGDFGMTRSMYQNDYYKFNRKGMLPVRWMSPESLSLGVFTPASDVWSYGVLLFEIITFGNFPFQGMTNNEVLAYVMMGNCLEIPKRIDPLLAQLIKSCWMIDSARRPTAPEILDYLANHPELVSPCLDQPAASVQPEDPAQGKVARRDNISLPLPMSWSVSGRHELSTLYANNRGSDPTNAPLLEAGPSTSNMSSNVGLRDRSTPHAVAGPSRAFQSNDIQSEDISRYINLQSAEIQVHQGEGIPMEELNTDGTRR